METVTTYGAFSYTINKSNFLWNEEKTPYGVFEES
jgi:hypothetical protein